ncbi:MAG: sugar ABC transporter permease [Oscillospiraceae bacterium]|nr:sugar ABC transporter permease [Oscillospiraceae bacterium]
MRLRTQAKRIGDIFDARSHWVMLIAYLLLFFAFILLPIILAVGLSFTNFNSVSIDSFEGLQNYIRAFTQDTVFMQKILPNTILYALIVGPGGYLLSFVVAWMLSQLTKTARTILAVVLYIPSLIAGVTISTIWVAVFNGDRTGYLNDLLLQMGLINEPVSWLQSSDYLMPIMIFVALWSSMGIGFLSMLSGILNVDREQYEAGLIDGISNRVQEVIYITIPNTKSQMLFGAVMAVVNTFNTTGLGVALSGSNPTPQYAGSLIVNHIDDIGFIRYEMGYAAALSVLLLIIVWLFNKLAYKLFGSSE